MSTILSQFDPTSLSARFCGFVEDDDHAAALFVLATLTRVHLGTRSAVFWHSRAVFPTLYTLVVSGSPWVADCIRCFSFTSEFPVIFSSGLRNSESLIYAIRDPLSRPEKCTVRAGQMPAYAVTLVDSGTFDKRLLIPNIAGLLARTKPAEMLCATVREAFRDGLIRWYMSHKDGGYLSCRSHISIVAQSTPTQARMLSQRLPLLAAPMHNSFHFDSKDRDVCAFMVDYERAIQNAPERVELGPDSAPILISRRISLRGTDAELQLIRLAHVFAILDRSDTIMVAHALQALALFETAAHTFQGLCSEEKLQQVETAILEILRGTGKGCLDRRSVVRLLGHRTQRSVTTSAIEHLTTSVLSQTFI